MNEPLVAATFLDNIFIILVGTTHPGNIGAAARAMKTMGLKHLRLVQPQHFPSLEATARASGADDLLAHAEIFDRFEDSLQGCRLVFGSSARQRSIRWSTLHPRQCATQALESQDKVAIVFGREHSGLTNDELDHCHYMLQIPTDAHFSSLNLAAAVQVVSYELRCRADELCHKPLAPRDEMPVSAEQMQLFYLHLEQTLIDIEFLDPEKPRRLMRRLQRLFNRAQPVTSEMNLLRGILTAAQKRKPS